VPYEPHLAFQFLLADGEPGHDYRAVVSVLAGNADRFGDRMTLGEIAAAVERDPAPLDQRLEQLYKWETVTRQHNGQEMTSLKDLRLRAYTYDISPAGSIAWEARLRIAALSEDIGKLSIARVHTLQRRLTTLVDAACAQPVVLPELRAAFEDVQQEVTRLRDEINAFRKELDDRLRPADGAVAMTLSTVEFQRFRDLVLAHIADFQNHLPRMRRDMSGVFARLAEVMDEQLVQLADYDVAAGLDTPTAREQRLARLRSQWAGIRAWLHDDVSGAESRWTALNDRLVTAIGSLVETAQRIAGRDRGRIDRTARLRSYAALTVGATDEDADRLWMAVTGRFPSRHFAGADHDPQRASNWAPRVAYREATAAPVTAHLLRSGAKGTSNAPGARVRDVSAKEREHALLRQERREDRARRLARLVDDGSGRRLSQLPLSDPRDADIVVGLLVAAFGLGCAADDRVVFDELVRFTVAGGQDAGPQAPLATLACGGGSYTVTDLFVSLRASEDPIWAQLGLDGTGALEAA
jgi:uncharacterized protein (TIGR02677 family)